MEEKKFVNKGGGRRVNVCHNCRYKQRNQEYKDRANAKRSNYSLYDGQKNDLFKEQNGLCAICQTSTKLVVDHDHITGKVRGLLCHNCNIGIGNMKDSPDILRAASLYLLKY
jgi:protein-arginine kinase activator protein McsA